MMTLLIKLLLPILMFFQNPSDTETSEPEITSTTIREIDISYNSSLSKILDEVTDSVRYGDRPGYYALNAERYHQGVMIRIERYDSALFEKRQYPFAFTKANDRLIVINHINGINFKEISNPERISIKTAKMEGREDISYIFFYYIIGDLYARFSPEAGWIWSDGLPDI